LNTTDKIENDLDQPHKQKDPPTLAMSNITTAKVERFSNNPLIKAADVRPSRPDMEVLCVFNPGATLYNKKKLLLIRVGERPIQEKGYVSTAIMDEETGELEVLRFRLDDPDLNFTDPRLIVYRGLGYVTTISHLRTAISENGRDFKISDTPTLMGSGWAESYGIEDARITHLEGNYYLNYTGASASGVITGLARTKDFQTFEKLGVIFAPDNKDVAIFPEKINGRYHCLHRPAVKHLGHMAVWQASSNDLLDWGRHHTVLAPRFGYWDSERVGAGAAPIKTAQGWLELYHAADQNMRYCTGAVLLDLEEPWKVIARSDEPFLYPEASYEMEGFLPNVVFHSGVIDNGNGTLDLYYGAADCVTCGATISIDSVLSSLRW
jgi:beta-1,2-mannobiose phosphorylase / 1,2-beta-oligomannan phosphorylase